METDSIPDHTESLSEVDVVDHVCEYEYTDKIKQLNSNIEEQKSHLENKLDSLRNYMMELREGLTKERELWKNEIEEVTSLTKTLDMNCPCGCEEENSSRHPQIFENQPTLNDMSILDYEQKLSLYQDALIRAHAEKKMHLRRHFAAHAYKTKLLEVENMCNLELMKVKQNVQFLQPLQAIASEWSFEQPISNNLDDELTGGPKFKSEAELKREHNTAIENFGNMVNLELKELANRLTPVESIINANICTTSSIQDSNFNEESFPIF